MQRRDKGVDGLAPDVEAFNGACEHDGAESGIFTCFEDRVTRPIRDVAAGGGVASLIGRSQHG